MFEYKTIKIKPKGMGITKLEIEIEEIDSILNELGAEGWKMTSSYPVVVNGYTNAIYYTFIKNS